MLHHVSPVRDTGPETFPELLLVQAILVQAVKDLHDARPQVREDARRFWGDRRAVEMWADALDLDASALTARVRRLLDAS
jgi:hypothetical protein